MEKTSLRAKLIFIFLLTSAVPIVLLGFFMSYTTTKSLKDNTDVLMQTNMQQLDDNMQIWLNSYEDTLYQLYTDDNMVAWVDRLNAGENVEVTINQMRRTLSAALNAKDYIRAITVITDNGMTVTYDQSTVATYNSSWIPNFSMSSKELYQDVIQDNATHIYSTEYATTFATKDFYFFHLAHRVIDYRKLEKRSAIIVLSLDETMLMDILGREKAENSQVYLIDGMGRIIACDQTEEIGTVIYDTAMTEQEKQRARRQYFNDVDILGKYNVIYSYKDEALDWDMVYLVDQTHFMKEQARSMRIILFVCLAFLVITVFLIWGLSGRLVTSVREVVGFMKKTGSGNMSVRIPLHDKMTKEIETIAVEFNGMLEKLEEASQRERAAAQKQQEAEIRALEAQINPHFLYNTLDTINWMAIDKDEFDISNAINSLATILRYAIANSNEQVAFRSEIEWLKKYIYLQQFRLKNKFSFQLDVAEEAMDCRVHKLLLQPFVENAIIHGFEGKASECRLTLRAQRKGDCLEIEIQDNGKGMDEQITELINENRLLESGERRHIGFNNAVTRIRMYYGEKGHLSVKSVPMEGTTVMIILPVSLMD